LLPRLTRRGLSELKGLQLMFSRESQGPNNPSPKDAYSVLRPLLFSLPPELAHSLIQGIARAMPYMPGARPSLKSWLSFESPRLEVSLWGKKFANPIGMAAGFDKNASLLGFIDALGFGFSEIGSLTNKPSPGNPRPRLFRLPRDRALVNRMGLNNDGAQVILERLKNRAFRNMPLGVNIAKTNDPSIVGEAEVEDFCSSYQLTSPYADFVVVNVSCPNTKEGNSFEDPEPLNLLLAGIYKERQRQSQPPPLLVKFSVDNSPENLKELLAITEAAGVDGYVLSNTSSKRQNLKTRSRDLEKIGLGGLSGYPLQSPSIALVKTCFIATGGKKPIIGVGGVRSARSAFRFIKAGASLVELYTGLVYEGPRLVRHIKQGLLRMLDQEGLETIEEARGLDVPK